MLHNEQHQDLFKLKQLRDERVRIIDCICECITKTAKGNWKRFFGSSRKVGSNTARIKRQLLQYGGQGLRRETMTEILLTASAAVRSRRLEAIQAVRDLERMQGEIDVVLQIWYRSKRDLWAWRKYPADPERYEKWLGRPEDIAKKR